MQTPVSTWPYKIATPVTSPQQADRCGVVIKEQVGDRMQDLSQCSPMFCHLDPFIKMWSFSANKISCSVFLPHPHFSTGHGSAILCPYKDILLSCFIILQFELFYKDILLNISVLYILRHRFKDMNAFVSDKQYLVNDRAIAGVV